MSFTTKLFDTTGPQLAAANVAGVQVGIGDYRPKFGRFKTEFN
jgi:hypothetical protein